MVGGSAAIGLAGAACEAAMRGVMFNPVDSFALTRNAEAAVDIYISHW